MIRIDGKTIQPGEITEYPSGSGENAIISVMEESRAEYSYNTAGQLKFELLLRAETVAAAQELNRSGLNFAVFRDTTCNSVYWNRTPDGGFRLKDGVSPSKAIRDIFQNGSSYGTECATAMVIVFYGALLHLYGEKRFDELCPNIFLMNWKKVDKRLRGIDWMEKRADYFPGDRRYFMNPDVSPLTPQWQGENVIDLNGNQYYGHGVGILGANAVIHALNANRDEDAGESAYLMDAAGRPDYKSLSKLME